MIPHQIYLKNFLSYGPQAQTVDFRKYNLICLSGKNGHGKSALLDAMTWAIWGQGRKIIGTAKADSGLIRLGQSHMLVIFDFEFNEKTYRIRREYTESYGKQVTNLDFGIINTETQNFIPLTDKTLRATQEKIEQTLRLDFEAFSNSAFLRQGNANEFSKKSPKDRKQILASILGLDQYEVIRKKALEKIKDATVKKSSLMHMQQSRLDELAIQPQLTADYAELTQKMNAIAIQEKEFYLQQTTLEKEKLLKKQQQTECNLLLNHKAQLQEKEKNHQTNLLSMLQLWRKINKQKKHVHPIDQLEKEKHSTICAISKHQKNFHNSLEKKEQLLHINQQINDIVQKHTEKEKAKNQTLLLELERLTSEQKNRDDIAAMLNDELQKQTRTHSELINQIDSLNKQLNSPNKNAHVTISDKEKKIEKGKAHYHHFVSLGNVITSELNNIIHKKKLALNEEDPSCPLCEQNLSASRRRFLKANFDKTELFLRHRLTRLKTIIPLLKESLIKQHEQLTKDKELVAHTHKVELTLQTLEIQKHTSYDQCNALETKYKNLQETINSHTTIIATKQTAYGTLTHNSHTTITDPEYFLLIEQKKHSEKDLQENSYNPELYTTAQNELTQIEQRIAEYALLKKEIDEQETRKKNITALCLELKAIKVEIKSIDKKVESFNNLAADIMALEAKEKDHRNAYSILNESKNTLLQCKGSIENQLKHLGKIKDDYEKEIKNITTLNSIIDDYQIISAATGKDGIQALLIEEAIPEIEQEANDLLAQLTDNQAQIFIESLRDLKKGGTKETLDIKISDQNGIRPYEMFSGGEAFRIDFALRIAISKLLARRAGTALQTLIIDEGFGSQDEEGLSHIMDALHIIQNNFSKIIVVSHLPAMKDQFPVHFHVQKGIQGSTVTVIEQG